MKNYILDPLPRSLIIDGTDYPLETDFRAVLNYNRIIREGREDGGELLEALRLMFGCIPENVVEAVLQLNWFVQGGEQEKRHRPSNKLLGINSDTPMDYDTDSRMIWAAFRRVYGIDLRAVEYIHWWDFLEMLSELPEDIRLNRIIEIRTKDTANRHLSREERTLYKALQRYYKIREPMTEKQEKLMEALRNGEDPTPYL